MSAPAAEAVDELTFLDAYLRRVEEFVRRFVVLSDDQAAAVTLWVAHTHAITATVVAGYLDITSATKRAGKSRLLDVLRLLVANPWLTGGTTKAALVRKIDRDQPTLLLDESDAAFNGDKDYSEALRGVLNNGFVRGTPYTTCVGNSHQVQDFDVFGPKAIAGIGRLPDTVEDRSIPIRLKRRARSEHMERFRARKARPVGEVITDGLAATLEPLITDLERAEPELPEELDDRAWDLWEPLLAIADAAGGDWPGRSRAAAVRLMAGRQVEDDAIGVRLLADCRTLFENTGEDRFPSKELRGHLIELDEAPWGDWSKGNSISLRKIADLLRRFDIRSRSIRIGETTRKGYLREQFSDAFDRYLPSIPGPYPAQRHNGSTEPETALFQTAQDPHVPGRKTPEKPLEQADVPDVPDREPEYEADDTVAENPSTNGHADAEYAEAEVARLAAKGLLPEEASA